MPDDSPNQRLEPAPVPVTIRAGHVLRQAVARLTLVR
jgi:hypothetical protein